MPKNYTINKGGTSVVAYKIFSEGKDLSTKYRLISLDIKRGVNRISSASLVLHDGDSAKQDFEGSNQKDLIPGKKVKIELGYETDSEVVFEGIVIKHGIAIRQAGPTVLQIELRHEAIKATIGRNSAYFLESKDSDIISELLDKHGLSGKVDATKTEHKEMVQYNVSDWDFLSMRADVNGLLVYTDDKGVTVGKPKMGKAVLDLAYGINIIEFEAEMDARHQVQNVKATSWDFSKQEVAEAEAAKGSITGKELGNISVDDLADVLKVKEYTYFHSEPLQDGELQAMADARLLRNTLAKIRGKVKIEGFGKIMPGDTISLNGVGDRFNGDAFVSGVYHDMDQGIWTTEIEFGLTPEMYSRMFDDIIDLPVSGIVHPISGLHVGVVTSLEDEDKLDRVQVKIPIISSKEDGVWARIVNLTSGTETGVFFRPDVGDEVIVGFLNDDPRNPVVLGSVHNDSKAPPFEMKDDNFEKGIITKEQLKLVFNDELKSVVIETPEGNKISISEDEKGILIEDQNKNKIEMTKDGITMESAKDFIIKAKGDVKIDGVNIEQKASSGFKADGKGGAELTTSAIATIKGSLVKIN